MSDLRDHIELGSDGVRDLKNYIELLLSEGGPEPSQYEELNNRFKSIGNMVSKGELSQSQVQEIWQVFDHSFLNNTMTGLTISKPNGYAGDFDLIDKILIKWISSIKHFQKWDHFSHWQLASQAVRNRKEFFKSILAKTERSKGASVLNIGSGPCRDIYEYICQSPKTKINFECLDMDSKAIEFSKNLLAGHDINFTCCNVFKFKAKKQYDLVWSAGLFDYLNDKQFIFLLKSLLKIVSHGGELIIGNFSEDNPSRDYMEFGGWFLHHRSDEKLFELAKSAGVKKEYIIIEKETLGVNLFLRVKE